MSTQAVNLEGISTITWDNFPVNKLVVDGTTNWMKVDDKAYSVGGKVWVSGAEKTITALDDTGAGSVTYVEGGSDVVLATTDSTLSVIDPSDPNQTPYSVGQTLYIDGVTAKEVQSISNNTTILFTDQTTLDYANLGSTTISTAPTNSTLFYVGQTLYVGSDDRVVSSIVGSVIYFTDGTNIDSANLGTSTLSTTAPQGNLTPFNVDSSIGSLVTINIDNTTRTDAPDSNGFTNYPEDYGYRKGYVVGVVGNLIEIQGYNGLGSNGTSYYYTNGVINTWYFDYSKTSAWNYLTYGVNSIWANEPYSTAWNDTANSLANYHKMTRWVNNAWLQGWKYVTAFNKGLTATWNTGTIGVNGETSDIQHTSAEHPYGQYIGGPMKWVGTKTGHTASISVGLGSNYDDNIFVTAMTQNQITGRNLDGLIFTCTFDPQTRTWTYA
jgi:hypothetical protein